MPSINYFRRASFLVVAFILVLIGLAPASAIAAEKARPGNPKLDRALRDLGSQSSGAPVPVIITATDGCPALDGWLETHARTRGHHPAINAVSADVDSRDFDSLSAVSCVKSVSVDAPVGAHQVNTAALMTLDKVRASVGSDQTSYTGSGIGVAVIDSGIVDRPDLHGRIKAFYDFTQGGKKMSAYDDYGHGTHVAATIGSSGQESAGDAAKGLAPAVNLIGLKVLDRNGSGITSNVINAVTFATANKAALGIDVINLSLGHPIYESASTDPLVRAVEQAVKAGIVVVVSAGNFGTNPTTGLVGYAGITSPGNSPSAITVGASQTSGTDDRSDDVVAPYSSRGPSWYDGFAKPDLVAPGHRIMADTSDATLYKKYTTLRVSLPGFAGKYLRLSGSSMSTAVVTGTVAQLLHANRSTKEPDGSLMARLNPYAVKALLQYTATHLANADALAQGAGEVNAAGAIALMRALDTRVQPWTIGAVTPSTTFGGRLQVWSTNIVWGTSLLFADDNIVWGTSALFDDNIVWGTSDDNIVWGTSDDNIVWGTSILFDDNIVWGTNCSWDDNIVWGTSEDDNIVWGTSLEDSGDDNIVWGTWLQLDSQ